MSPRVLTLAVAAAALLAVPGPATAATGCFAVATPPRPDPSAPGLHASGTFGCAVPAFDLYVEVCVERLADDAASWTVVACSATVLNDGGAAVTADVTIAAPEETAVLRTTVFGQNDRGDTASGTSAPIVWPRCGCP